jgi:hypothetical protein
MRRMGRNKNVKVMGGGKEGERRRERFGRHRMKNRGLGSNRIQGRTEILYFSRPIGSTSNVDRIQQSYSLGTLTRELRCKSNKKLTDLCTVRLCPNLKLSLIVDHFLGNEQRLNMLLSFHHRRLE